MTSALWLAAVLCACNPSARVSPGDRPAAPQPAAAPAPAAAGSIGTAHPLTVDHIAHDGSWLVLCQARADTDEDGKIEVGYGMHGRTFGDRLEPYLVLGSGEGTPIDGFVTRAGNDAWLAVILDGKLQLIEAATRRFVPLPDADLRDDGAKVGDARAAAIAGNATRMTYVRHGAGGDHIVIRDLASGQERAVAVDGTPWRMQLDSAGRWARVAVLPAGAAWPTENTRLPRRDCLGPLRSFTTTGRHGAKPTQRWLDLEHGVFVAAAKVPGDVTSELEHPHDDDDDLNMGTLWCDQASPCIDVQTDRPRGWPAGTVEYVSGDRVLIRAGDQRSVFAPSTRTSATLAATGPFGGGDGPIVALGDGLYDLNTTRRVGSSRSDVVVAHAGRRVLLGHAPGACTPRPGDMPYACVDGVADPAAGGVQGLPIGPLRWAP